MKTLLRPRKPASDLDDVTGEELTGEAPLASQWTAGASLATRIATVVLWAALLAGPAALLLVVAAEGGGAAPPPAPAVVDDTAEAAAAQEFAQRLVTAWLTTPRGGEQAVSALVADADVVLPVSPWTVSNPAIAQVARLPDQPGLAGAQLWSVTVAVDVAAGRQPATRRFFQVPVQRDSAGALVALTQPAPIAAPGLASAAQSAASHDVDTSSPLHASVQQFLAAMLAAQSDVTRYVTPGAAIAAVTPAPYTSVELTALSADVDVSDIGLPVDGQQARVVATATAAVSDDQRISVTYPLTLTARSGRWEVTSIDPAPPLDPEQAGIPEPTQ